MIDDNDGYMNEENIITDLYIAKKDAELWRGRYEYMVREYNLLVRKLLDTCKEVEKCKSTWDDWKAL